ncbi:MAG TPA: TIGR03619 family F420-dependent LLM class oxidoreductase, partial [Mycolicibacillus parakoreensis]|nr:TIGR03619 family F420-dependent LLM class oxidoreductase [Mycolicibacillus parakoreensis]
MKYTCSVAMGPIEQLTALARTAEEVGFDAIALPDSLFFMESAAADYPYTPDGSRMWDENTPWVDPLIAAAAMGAVTTGLRFYTNVLKLGSRNPLLLARQVGSVANLTGNRFGFGVGIGWAPEEFEWCGVPYARRGARVDEMIEVIKKVLVGGMVEHHGEFFDFDRLQMSPAPSEPVPFYVGGHTGPALKRAARVGDGWTSAMMTCAQLAETIGRLKELRAEYGRTEVPFEYQAVCIDKFDVDGHR